MWFSARMLFECELRGREGRAVALGSVVMNPASTCPVAEGTVVDAPARPLQEERIMLFEAADKVKATEKATILAKTKQVGYSNAEGDFVKWRFIEVSDVQDVRGTVLYDGIDVYSRML